MLLVANYNFSIDHIIIICVDCFCVPAEAKMMERRYMSKENLAHSAMKVKVVKRDSVVCYLYTQSMTTLDH